MHKTKWIAWAILFSLLLASVSALELDTEPEACRTAEFTSPTSWISCGLAKTYQNFADFLIVPLEQITESFGQLMIINIDTALLKPYWSKIRFLSSFLIIIMLMYAGYQFMFSAIEAERRKLAKQQLRDLIYVLLFVNLSLVFGSVLFQISNGLISYVWHSFLNEQISSMTVGNIVINGTSTLILAVFYLIVLLFIGIPFFIKIITRHLVVMALICLLPIIIILYYFIPTKQYGRKLLEILLINAFFPFLWMLIFAMGKIAVDVLQATLLPVNFGLLSFLALTATLYVNNRLYKQIALNFDISTPFTQTVHNIRTAYTKMPEGFKQRVRSTGGKVIDAFQKNREINYHKYKDPLGETLD